MNKTEEKGFFFPSEQIFRKANARGWVGRLRVDEGPFGKVCYVGSWDSGLTRIESCLWDQLLSFLVAGNPLQMHIALVVKQGRQRALLSSASPPLTTAQNSLAKMTYFGLAYCVTLQLHWL